MTKVALTAARLRGVLRTVIKYPLIPTEALKRVNSETYEQMKRELKLIGILHREM